MSDSAAVLALKARLKPRMDACRRKRVYSLIRRQRLLEARDLGTHTEEQWEAVLARFDYRCVICGCTPEGRPCKDHITPIRMGGSDAIENLQPTCRECNTGKGRSQFNWATYRDAHGFEAAVA